MAITDSIRPTINLIGHFQEWKNIDLNLLVIDAVSEVCSCN